MDGTCLGRGLFEDHRSIVTAESKGIDHGNLGSSFLDLAGDASEYAGWIGIVVIHRRMDLPGLQGQARHNAGQRTGRSESMADQRFRRADGAV